MCSFYHVFAAIGHIFAIFCGILSAIFAVMRKHLALPQRFFFSFFRLEDKFRKNNNNSILNR